MVSRWADMLTYRISDPDLALRPGSELKLPGVWATSPPLALRIREVQPAHVVSPPSCWAHCVDELGRPVQVYVTAPQEP